MTTVLGLHFGHDGNAAVIKDGKLTGYVLRERLTRRKHDYGLDRHCLEMVLDQAKVSPEDIDYCAITSTQGCDAPLFEMGEFSIRYLNSDPGGFDCPLLTQILSHGQSIESQCAPSMLSRVLSSPRDPSTHPVFVEHFKPYTGLRIDDLKLFPWFEGQLNHPLWSCPNGLGFLSSLNAVPLIEDAKASNGFHLPVMVRIGSRDIPGFRVDHHLAHASSSYYRSPFLESIVITNDGYGGKRKAFSNGAVYFGQGRKIYPIYPHLMTMGHLYHTVAMEIGFDPTGAPGKLMGLAPYGRPLFHDPRRIGNHVDICNRRLNPDPLAWIEDVRWRAGLLRLSVDAPAEDWIPFNRYQLDLAASTQKLFEEQWLALVRAAIAMAEHSNLDAGSLCLSGGAVLNGPSNSRILRESGVSRIFMEPNVDDGGLSIGAALWVTHHMLDKERLVPLGMSISEAYAGPNTNNSIQAIIVAATAAGFAATQPDDPAYAAAVDLAAGEVIGWFEGLSEQGPRALGHRSILALPMTAAMRDRINRIKRRELWRPLAPSVLEEQLETYFDDLPVKSPFMLFTAGVKHSDQYPAITHVDGSARVQTVSADCGEFRKVLEAVAALTGCALILNTSLNGPREPIVETPDEALRFLTTSELDVIYVDGVRIRRK